MVIPPNPLTSRHARRERKKKVRELKRRLLLVFPEGLPPPLEWLDVYSAPPSLIEEFFDVEACLAVLDSEPESGPGAGGGEAVHSVVGHDGEPGLFDDCPICQTMQRLGLQPDAHGAVHMTAEQRQEVEAVMHAVQSAQSLAFSGPGPN